MGKTATHASRLAPFFKAVARRGLASSLLLFAAGHRPFAFLAGQAIYMAEPLCDLLGLPGSRDLAELLSRPDAIDQIESSLLAADAPENPALQNLALPNSRPAHVLE